MPTHTPVLFLALALSCPALAQTHTTPLTLLPAAVSFDDAVATSSEPTEPIGRCGTGMRRYLDANWSWWTFGVGASVATNNVSDAQAFVAYSYFVDDSVEFTLDFALRSITQDGDDAIGFNPGFSFRYHFWASESRDWTAFADIGIGVMGSTSDIPEAGTSINFTPRAGIGFTRALSNDWRLIAAVRWSHISNGRIFGNDDNPASDGVALTIGFITSF